MRGGSQEKKKKELKSEIRHVSSHNALRSGRAASCQQPRQLFRGTGRKQSFPVATKGDSFQNIRIGSAGRDKREVPRRPYTGNGPGALPNLLAVPPCQRSRTLRAIGSGRMGRERERPRQSPAEKFAAEFKQMSRIHHSTFFTDHKL